MIFSTCLAVRDLLLLREAPVQRVGEEVALHLERAPGHDVVERRHPLEQRDVLERAREAQPRDGVRGQVRPVLALEEDLCRAGPVERR